MTGRWSMSTHPPPGCPRIRNTTATSRQAMLLMGDREKRLVTRTPNVGRVLWRVGLPALDDDQVDPAQARRFFCPDCSDGDLLLQKHSGEGWLLDLHAIISKTRSTRRRRC